MPYYAVKVGHQSGIYETWPECKKATDGARNSIYRKFETRIEAEQFMNRGNVKLPQESYKCQSPPFALNKPVQPKTEGVEEVLVLSDDEIRSQPKIPKLDCSPTISNFVSVNDQAEQAMLNVQPCTSHSNEIHSDTQRKLQTVIETAVKVAISCNDFNNCNLFGVTMDAANQNINIGVNVNFLCDCTCKSVNNTTQIPEIQVSRKRKATNNVAMALNKFSFSGTGNDIVPVPRRTPKIQPRSRIKTAQTYIHATSEGERVVVYTDGACENNGFAGAVGGIGVYWGPGNPLNVSERLHGRQTNNRAEIMAAVKALQQVKAMGKTKVTLYTDSKFLISGITAWIHKWKQNGWKLATGGDVVNRQDFEALESASAGIDVEWLHVSGHRGVPGNEQADKLAKQGSLRQYF